MVHKNENTNNGASDKAIKKEVESKGLGVPQSTGVSHDAGVFNAAPARNIGISSIAPEGDSRIDNVSAGSDSAVGAAGADGKIEIAGGAETANVPPENIDVRK